MGHSTRRLMMGAAGAGGDKKYTDEVFSIDVYKGTGTMSGSTDSGAKTITNSIDYSEGALTWLKQRSHNDNHQLFDTVRGDNKRLVCNENTEETTTAGDRWGLKFNSNGYTLGNAADGINVDGRTNVGWSFRKAKGFFDIVKYNGSDSEQNIAHNLGCVPGCILVKRLNGGSGHDWAVLHRGFDEENPGTQVAWLNLSNGKSANSSYWDNTAPTSTHFCVKAAYAQVNQAGGEYIAYLFAGGASTAATARSVDFDGSGDYLTQTCDAVLRNWWDQAFTVEYWVNADGFVSSGNGGSGVLGVCAPTSNGETWSFGPQSNGTVEFYYWNGSIQQVTTTKTLNLKQWYHLAMVYDGSSSIKIYINGTLEQSATVQGTPTGSSTVFSIGKIANGSEFNGKVSNVRIAHQALYASSFRPPTKPLENITNTKLLCCNNSSVTGSTVTPATITAVGDPTASTLSPFDDPACFTFGEEGDQNIIKCGRYTGKSIPNEVYTGWEPQWVMIKNMDTTQSWYMWDNMRGVRTTYNGTNSSGGSKDNYFKANTQDAEVTTLYALDFTSSGFLIEDNGDWVNTTNGSESFIYIAIRAADGATSKLPEAGTDAFTMDAPTGSASTPEFTSNFPVEFGIYRKPASSQPWFNSARRLTYWESKLNDTSQAAEWANGISFDYPNGWAESGAFTPIGTYQSWMWKRTAAFEVVTYLGNSSGDNTGDWQDMPHNLGRAPEMIWVKGRNGGGGYWGVYHKGLNGGTNPWNYRMLLNDNHTESDGGAAAWYWNDTAPTATHFSLGDISNVNQNNIMYYAMLFASVEGISKVGYYDGQNTELTITTGFQPRFLIIKKVNASLNWFVADTTRGWGANPDQILELNNDGAQFGNNDFGAPTATGFTLNGAETGWNESGGKYIYYAHA